MLKGVRGSTVFGIVLGIALLVSLINSLSGQGERNQDEGNRRVEDSSVEGLSGGMAETREVDDFNAISLSGVGTVRVFSGDEPSLVVHAPKDILSSLQTRVRNDTLTIEVARRTRLPRRSNITYEVVTPNLERLEVSGAGDIRAEKVAGDDVTLSSSGSGSLYVEDVQAEELEADLSGAGDMQLSGAVTEQKVTVSGAGSYQACALVSEDAEIDISGAGDAFVQATDTLDVSVSGASDVRYLGNPEVSTDVSGAGSVSSSESCDD